MRQAAIEITLPAADPGNQSNRSSGPLWRQVRIRNRAQSGQWSDAKAAHVSCGDKLHRILLQFLKVISNF
jgi:hypothetical protein